MKQRLSRNVMGPARKAIKSGQLSLWDNPVEEIWQRRFYYLNVWTERKRIEKLNYMHHHPVKRGLVSEPGHWAGSSCRAYTWGEAGRVTINDCEVLQMKRRSSAA